MKVRLLRFDEIKIVCKIADKNYPGEEWVKNASNELKSMFSTCAIKPKYFVVEENNKIIGFAGYCQSWMDYDIYEFFWVNIDPSFQKKGVGTFLIKKIIEKIRNIKDAKFILLTTDVKNFYENIGFKNLSSFSVDGFQLKYLDLRNKL